MKTTINLKERHANFKALSVLNLAWPRGVASNSKRACREKSNLAWSRGASLNFASSQGRGLNFMRPCGAEFQKGRA